MPKSYFSEQTKIWPNPTCDNAIIELINHQEVSVYHISIFDISGNKVIELKSSIPKIVLDTKTLTNGMYIIKIKTENEELSLKLIKM